MSIRKYGQILVMVSFLVVSLQAVGLAKYIEDRDDAHQVVVARSMQDQTLVRNQKLHRWMFLDLVTANDGSRGYTEFDLNTTTHSKDDPSVVALGIFFNHNDDNGRVYFPDKDNAVFFHNKAINFQNYYLEEDIQLHANELRNRILQAESITIKVKMEDSYHKIIFYSFDLSADALGEWKKLAEMSLNTEQGS